MFLQLEPTDQQTDRENRKCDRYASLAVMIALDVDVYHNKHGRYLVEMDKLLLRLATIVIVLFFSVM